MPEDEPYDPLGYRRRQARPPAMALLQLAQVVVQPQLELLKRWHFGAKLRVFLALSAILLRSSCLHRGPRLGGS